MATAMATREEAQNEGSGQGPPRNWAVEPPRSAKSIFHKFTGTGTFMRPTTAPTITRFDPVPGLPNLVQGVPASPRGKRLVPGAHRMPVIPVKGATPSGPWAECRGAPSHERMRRAAWPRQGTENSLMYRNPLERRAAHDGWGEEEAAKREPGLQVMCDTSHTRKDPEATAVLPPPMVGARFSKHRERPADEVPRRVATYLSIAAAESNSSLLSAVLSKTQPAITYVSFLICWGAAELAGSGNKVVSSSKASHSQELNRRKHLIQGWALMEYGDRCKEPLAAWSSSSDENGCLLGGSKQCLDEGNRRRGDTNSLAHRDGQSPQSRVPAAVCYALSGLMILTLLTLNVVLDQSAKGGRSNSGAQHRVNPEKFLASGLVLEDEASSHGVVKKDIVVGVGEGDTPTVVTENCVWHSCGMNTVCRLSADDATVDGDKTVNATNASHLEECKQKCERLGEDNCTGVEYNNKSRRCELWTRPILSHRSCLTGHDCPEANYSCHTMQCKAIDHPVRLQTSERSFQDSFGRSIGISGDTVVVGAPGDNDRGDDSGAAYVFVRKANTFVEQAKLTADDGFRNSFFGNSVSIAGGRILVGAYRDGLNGKKDSGSAYVFRRAFDVWEQEAKLSPEDAVENERFGSRVGLFGDMAVVTSAGNAAKNASAAIYLFHVKGKDWVLKAKLAPPQNLKNSSKFGTSLSQSKTTIMIGAEEDDTVGKASGAVYVYSFNGTNWSQPTRLVANDTAAGDHFGCSVSLSESGKTCLVGAYGHRSRGKGSGAAYVFKRHGGQWVQQQQLVPEDLDADDGFGKSVSTSDSTAAIGAFGDEHGGVDRSGSAYIFVHAGHKWVQQSKLAPQKAEAGAEFGSVASISGHMATFSSAEQVFVFPAYLTQVCPST
ncbi:unnamed protein product [Symbiodinium natans]|uniref:Apple domain-containing protein n=1 Tax=Symbiodinium natans TaxID=878477 RepID=A0A812JW16_9DINO|nr:unnamed protein product [Symbiodinium natans]